MTSAFLAAAGSPAGLLPWLWGGLGLLVGAAAAAVVIGHRLRR